MPRPSPSPLSHTYLPFPPRYDPSCLITPTYPPPHPGLEASFSPTAPSPHHPTAPSPYLPTTNHSLFFSHSTMALAHDFLLSYLIARPASLSVRRLHVRAWCRRLDTAARRAAVPHLLGPGDSATVRGGYIRHQKRARAPTLPLRLGRSKHSAAVSLTTCRVFRRINCTRMRQKPHALYAGARRSVGKCGTLHARVWFEHACSCLCAWI